MSSTKSPTLLKDVRRIMRLKHYSLHTERSDCDWKKQYVMFHRMMERQALFEDSELETTMIYTLVLDQGGQGVVSPLDDLGI